jgi:hypothetical protein
MRSEDSLREARGKHGDSIQNKAQGLTMPDNSPTIFHSNRYHARAAYPHCEGIIWHEPWCITLHPVVLLRLSDCGRPQQIDGRRRPHPPLPGCDLGRKACPGNCKTNQTVESRAQA